MTAETRPRRILEDLVREHDDGARLQASRCDACALVVFPPARAGCPRCFAPTMRSVELGPRGTLRSFTAVHHPTPGSRVAPPYAVGVVAFDGGTEVIGLMERPEIDGLRVGRSVDVVVGPAYETDEAIVDTYRFRA